MGVKPKITIQKTNATKSWISTKINEIEKLLVKLTKKQSEET